MLSHKLHSSRLRTWNCVLMKFLSCALIYILTTQQAYHGCMCSIPMRWWSVHLEIIYGVNGQFWSELSVGNANFARNLDLRQCEYSWCDAKWNVLKFCNSSRTFCGCFCCFSLSSFTDFLNHHLKLPFTYISRAVKLIKISLVYVSFYFEHELAPSREFREEKKVSNETWRENLRRWIFKMRFILVSLANIINIICTCAQWWNFLIFFI